jgi:hypothetical protein
LSNQIVKDKLLISDNHNFYYNITNTSHVPDHKINEKLLNYKPCFSDKNNKLMQKILDKLWDMYLDNNIKANSKKY